MKRLMVLLVVCFTLTLQVFASGNTEDADGEGKRIAVSVNSMETVFYRDIIAELEKLIGPNDEIIPFDSKESSSTQITNLEDMLVKGYDLIFTTVMDPVGMRPVLIEAQKAGIPVIVFDFPSDDPDLVETTIIYNDYQLGELEAEGLADAMGYKGKILQYGDNSMAGPIQRNKAFEAVMAKYENIEIVGYAEGPPMSDFSYPAIEAMLTANPDADALWTMADAAGRAGVSVMQAANNDHVIIGSIGINDLVAGYIREGKMYGSVAQLAVDVAEKMWMAAEKVFSGQSDELEEVYYLPAYWCNSTNVDTYWPEK